MKVAFSFLSLIKEMIKALFIQGMLFAELDQRVSQNKIG